MSTEWQGTGVAGTLIHAKELYQLTLAILN